ncbi:MAG: hypothetical protein RID81_07225 [Sandaracinaceae bacterium]
MGKLHTFADGDTFAALDSALYATLRERSAVRPIATSWAVEQAGGVHRLAWILNLLPGESKVIDSSVDWRDRVILYSLISSAFGAAFPAWTASYPGGSRDYRFTYGGTRVWYSGPGTTEAAGGSAGWHAKLNDYFLIFADLTTGALTIYRDASDPSSDPAAFVFRFIAAEPAGEHSAPPTQPSPVPVNGDPIKPADLNVLQDHGLLTQATAGAVEIDALPLGPKKSGSPALPEVWTVHGQERRQPTAGYVRRYFGAELGTGLDSIELDASIDWRDRFLFGSGRVAQDFTPNDIYPGGSQDTLHNTEESWTHATYTGPGRAASVPAPVGADYLWHALEVRSSGAETFAIWARDTDGALVLGKDRGDPVKVTGWLEASFPVSSER